MSAELIPGNAWEGKQYRDITINNFYRHPSFDIALVKLPMPFNKVIRNGQYIVNTICLPQKTENSNKEIERAVMFGLGQTLPRSEMSNNLMKGTLSILPYTVCEYRNDWKDRTKIWNKMLCANTTMTFLSRPCTVSEAIICLNHQ
jgi:hypothetical protein